MTESTKLIRQSVDSIIDALEMSQFNDGYEAALNAVLELSNQLHNSRDTTHAEILTWAVKELRGENAENN